MLSKYTAQIMLALQEMKKNSVLSTNLLNPTPRSIKEECLKVYIERFDQKDKQILQQFFGVEQGTRDFGRLIIHMDTDKFRPLVNFLRQKVEQTNHKNVELLAWLINFHPRPFGSAKFEVESPLLESNPKRGSNFNEKRKGTDHLESAGESSPDFGTKEVDRAASNAGNIDRDGVFISYSWDNPVHEDKVVSFTDFLRTKGFHASLDKMLTQEETATDFVKMMHKAMHDHSKVIVVLSEGYKRKAETFTGGVGEEYQLLLNDINKSPRKYILVSFEGRSENIIPFGLQGRNIIDLSKDGSEESLYQKLMDEKTYVFSPVAAEKPQLLAKAIKKFSFGKDVFPIAIAEPSVSRHASLGQGGKYNSIEFRIMFNFKNLSQNSIEGFAFEIKLQKELIPNAHTERIADGMVILSDSFDRKIFPDQTIKSKVFEIKLMSSDKYFVIGSIISVTVYTDFGSDAKDFQVNELFAAPLPNGGSTEKRHLAKEMFQ
ncbi:SEFIR domain-containing protein [Pedobacter sp. 22163]|uniref:SEFIR domain-containing protein n=1 Tax=Pedobacter sp. 22163 TaxID=3453883 RepID=UPI003F855321